MLLFGSGTIVIVLLQLNLFSHSGTFASCCCYWFCSLDLAQLPLFVAIKFAALLGQAHLPVVVSMDSWIINLAHLPLLPLFDFAAAFWHIFHCVFLLSLLCNLIDSFINYQVRNLMSFSVLLHTLQFCFLWLWTGHSGCHCLWEELLVD